MSAPCFDAPSRLRQCPAIARALSPEVPATVAAVFLALLFAGHRLAPRALAISWLLESFQPWLVTKA